MLVIGKKAAYNKDGFRLLRCGAEGGSGRLSRADKKELSELGKQAEPLKQKLDVERIHEIETMRGICADYEGRAHIYMGGIQVLAFQLIHIIKSDLVIFGSAISVMICLMLFLLFRKIKWVVIPVVCCACSVLSTIGIFGMFGLKTTVISSNFILFPAMMALARRGRGENELGSTRRIMTFSTDVALKHPRKVAGVGAAIVVLSVIGMLQLDVENSFFTYFRSSTLVRKELSFIDKQFGGSTPLDLVYTIGAAEKEDGLVLTSDTVLMLQRIQMALQKHTAFGKIISIVNFTDLARIMNGGRPLTEYELTAVFGLLTGLAMTVALVSDLCLLPVLLCRFVKRR